MVTGDRWLVTGDRWQVTGDRWQVEAVVLYCWHYGGYWRYQKNSTDQWCLHVTISDNNQVLKVYQYFTMNTSRFRNMFWYFLWYLNILILLILYQTNQGELDEDWYNESSYFFVLLLLQLLLQFLSKKKLKELKVYDELNWNTN